MTARIYIKEILRMSAMMSEIQQFASGLYVSKNFGIFCFMTYAAAISYL